MTYLEMLVQQVPYYYPLVLVSSGNQLQMLLYKVCKVLKVYRVPKDFKVGKELKAL